MAASTTVIAQKFPAKEEKKEDNKIGIRCCTYPYIRSGSPEEPLYIEFDLYFKTKEIFCFSYGDETNFKLRKKPDYLEDPVTKSLLEMAADHTACLMGKFSYASTYLNVFKLLAPRQTVREKITADLRKILPFIIRLAEQGSTAAKNFLSSNHSRLFSENILPPGYSLDASKLEYFIIKAAKAANKEKSITHLQSFIKQIAEMKPDDPSFEKFFAEASSPGTRLNKKFYQIRHSGLISDGLLFTAFKKYVISLPSSAQRNLLTLGHEGQFLGRLFDLKKTSDGSSTDTRKAFNRLEAQLLAAETASVTIEMRTIIPTLTPR